MSEIVIERSSGPEYEVRVMLNGVVIGASETKAKALWDAIEKAQDILRALRNAWSDEIGQTRSLKPTRTTVNNTTD